jgi:hypothetical protein
VLPDRCLDIGAANFAGRSLAWQSSVGPVSPERYDPQGLGWLKSFGGGLLTTCGLRHFGVPDSENGESWGLHGRASHLSAEDVAIERIWEKGEYVIRIRGRVCESEVFKPTIVLERTISTALGSRALQIADRITNTGHQASPVMLLYHVNLGWPLLSEKSRLAVNASSVKPVTDHAASALDRHCEMLPPTAGFEEMCYVIEPKAGPDGLCRAALVNPELDGGTALSVEWPKATLPLLAEWKMMGQGVYVLGVEPCTCPFPPRADLRKRGLMPTLRPGQTLESGIMVRLHRGADELGKLARRI